jgi:hypothetical protein
MCLAESSSKDSRGPERERLGILDSFICRRESLCSSFNTKGASCLRQISLTLDILTGFNILKPLI